MMHPGHGIQDLWALIANNRGLASNMDAVCVLFVAHVSQFGVCVVAATATTAVVGMILALA